MRFQTVYDHGGDPTLPDRAPWFSCLLEGSDLVYRYVNTAYREAFGQKDFEGNSVFSVMKEVEGQEFFPILRKVFDSGSAHHGDTHVYLGDEDEHGPIARRIKYIYTAVRDRHGLVKYIAAEGQIWNPTRLTALAAKDRAVAHGPKSLTDRELLGLFLINGGQDRSADLLHRFGSLRGVFSASGADLQQVWVGSDGAARGLRASSLMHLQVTKEIHRRILFQRVAERPLLASSRLVHRYLTTSLSAESREQFRILFLDAGLRLIADEAMSVGTISHVAVYTREVVRRALELSAQSIILVHNHPSQNDKISQEDKLITEDIISAARTLRIVVHDHLIVAGETVVSLKSSRTIRGWAG